MALLSEPHRVYSRNVLLQVGQCVHDPPDYLRPALLSLRRLQRIPRRTRRGTKAGCRRSLRKIQTIVRNRLLKPASTHACNGVNYGYLRPINCCIGGGLASSKTASLVLLNVRSLRNIGEFIIDYISEHDIDVMCMTETWLTANDESLMPALIPAGYGFRHLPRSDRRGGGVGVMFKSSCHVSKSMTWLAESFECLQLVLTGANVASTLRIFIIYRPPSSGLMTNHHAITCKMVCTKPRPLRKTI